MIADMLGRAPAADDGVTGTVVRVLFWLFCLAWVAGVLVFALARAGRPQPPADPPVRRLRRPWGR